MSTLVVGTGLLGTSVGLALGGNRVLLADRDPDALAAAVRRGAGTAWDGTSAVDLAVVAVPPSVVARELLALQRAGVAAVLTHVCSVQQTVLDALVAAGADLTAVCGGHPMAGRETSGPGAASADLFAGRPWLVCPSPRTSGAAVQAVQALAAACGADPLPVEPAAHDVAMALVSHLPQVASSAVAAQLAGAAPEVVALAGPGLLDTTRLAASPLELWSELLAANARHVAPVLASLAADLAAAAAALAAGRPGPAEDLLRRGAAGRAALPVKRGRAAADYAVVRVDAPDRPGELVAVLTTAARAEVNVEDVRVDHRPGAARGTLSLSVAPWQVAPLSRALTDAGVRVLPD